MPAEVSVSAFSNVTLAHCFEWVWFTAQVITTSWNLLSPAGVELGLCGWEDLSNGRGETL